MLELRAQKEVTREKYCLHYYFYSDRYGNFVCPYQRRQ